MLLKTFTLALAALFATGIYAQNTFPSTGAAGIGTASPNASSLLEIKSTNKGILISRMTKTQRDAIATPATGLLIYQTNNTAGFYYYNGSAWTLLGQGTVAETDPQVGTIALNAVPRWDGTALVTGALLDNGSQVGVGINSNSQYRIDAAVRAQGEGGLEIAGKSALRGESNSYQGTSDNIFATGYLGVSSPGSIYNNKNNGFPDKTMLHLGGLGVKEPDSLQGAGLYGWNRGGADLNYGIKGMVTSLSGTNYGVYGEAAATGLSGATNGTKTGVMGKASSGLFNYGLRGEVITASGQAGYGIYATSTGAGTNFAALFEGHVRLVNDNEALTVYGTDPYIQMNENGTNTGYLRAKDGDLLLAVNSTNTAGNLQFLTKNQPRMWIDGNGNISISDDGKVKSGYLLNVKGKIVAEEVLVQLNSNWPDYVFNKSYKLMQLPELKKYISQNKHLPEVPSANEMKDGIAVGDMNKLLMQKVEELTLYVLQLNEEIDALKAKNK